MDQSKTPHSEATMLPWGVHRATADSELLRCLLWQDTIVGDRKQVKLTADGVCFDPFFFREILRPIFDLGSFSCGI